MSQSTVAASLLCRGGPPWPPSVPRSSVAAPLRNQGYIESCESRLMLFIPHGVALRGRPQCPAPPWPRLSVTKATLSLVNLD